MDYLDHLLSSNLFGTFIGWLAFNALMWRIEKTKSDRLHKPFKFSQYARETSDEWIVSAIFIPLILWIGYRSLALDPFAEDLAITGADWNDFYYLSAGFAPELAIKVLTKIGVIKADAEPK